MNFIKNIIYSLNFNRNKFIYNGIYISYFSLINKHKKQKKIECLSSFKN